MASITRCDGCGKLSDNTFGDRWMKIALQVTYPTRDDFATVSVSSKDVCSKQCALQVFTEEFANKDRYYYVREKTSG